jgi:hypothetical protein
LPVRPPEHPVDEAVGPFDGEVGIGFVVGHDGRLQIRLDHRNPQSDERLTIDPHAASVEARTGLVGRGIEGENVRGTALDRVLAGEAIVVRLVEGEIERKRDDLLGLDQRQLGDRLPRHEISVDVVTRLLPLQIRAATPEVVALDRDVERRPALRELEVEVDVPFGRPSLEAVVLHLLDLLVSGDDLLRRQAARGADLDVLSGHVHAEIPRRRPLPRNRHRVVGLHHPQRARGLSRNARRTGLEGRPGHEIDDLRVLHVDRVEEQTRLGLGIRSQGRFVHDQGGEIFRAQEPSHDPGARGLSPRGRTQREAASRRRRESCGQPAAQTGDRATERLGTCRVVGNHGEGAGRGGGKRLHGSIERVPRLFGRGRDERADREGGRMGHGFRCKPPHAGRDVGTVVEPDRQNVDVRRRIRGEKRALPGEGVRTDGALSNVDLEIQRLRFRLDRERR